MSARRKTALEWMDSLVRWTNASDMVKRDMSSEDSESRRNLPMRWLPLIPMGCGAGLVFAAIALPVPVMFYGIAGAMSGGMPFIHINGPLGKSSVDDDEREAALRKDAFLFCFAILAIANILGQPLLMVMAALDHWTIARTMGLAVAVVIGNLAWFTSLPTLYASWKLPRLSDE